MAGLATDQLLELLVECEALADRDSVAATSCRRVRMVEAYMRAHYATISSMVDVAEFAGVGLRSLQASFKAARGLSPREVLTRTRLEEARRRLLTGTDDSAGVTGVALACGFTHLGRFAQQYRRLYGESPSGTLGRRAA